MGKKQDDPRGKQKGAQEHAEGQHGEKAHSHFLEEIHASSGDEGGEVGDERPHPAEGGNRLFERRAQHDEAEKNSEKNRLQRDIDRHKHERSNFQVPGGAASHRVMPSQNIDPSNPDGMR